METALSDLRASALAAPGGVDTDLLREVDAALGTSTGALPSTLPASLIGLVAQRGHAALLTQLLKLSTTSAEPSRKNSDSALLTELQRCAHAAIVRGDGAAAAALLPDYDHGIAADGRHLQPEAAALPAYAALLASRRDATALRTLRVVGGAAWARAKGDHVTLAHLLASPEQLGAAPPAAAAPAAVAPPRPPPPPPEAPRDSALSVAAARGDVTTVELLLRGGGATRADELGRAALAGDSALFAALAAEGEQRVGAQPAPTPPAACAPSAATSASAPPPIAVDPLEEETQLANRLLARLEVEKIVTSARRGVEAKSVSRVAAADSLVALNLALSDGLASAGAPGAVDTPRSSMLAAKDQLSRQISALSLQVNTAARKAGVPTAAEAKAIAAAKVVVPAKAVAVATASAAPAKAATATAAGKAGTAAPKAVSIVEPPSANLLAAGRTLPPSPTRAAKGWALGASPAEVAPFTIGERHWLKLLSDSVGLERPRATSSFADKLPAIPLPGCFDADADARRLREIDERMGQMFGPTKAELARVGDTAAAPASVPPMSPGRSHFYDAQMDALKLKQKELEQRLAVTPIETLVTARIDPRVRVQ